MSNEQLRDELRTLVQNTYCVNEKRPPTYERKWKLHVLWNDGSSTTYWGEDSEAGLERVYREALRDATRDSDKEHAQRYDKSGDALIEDSGWWCEHEDDDGETVAARRLLDTRKRTITCPDCGTVWSPWTNPRGQRVAKAVVFRA